MKIKLVIFASLLTAISISTAGAQAASDTDKTAVATPSVNDTKMGQSPATKMKPHSHVEEKTGVPQKAPELGTAKPNPAKDMSKHYHPRDGK